MHPFEIGVMVNNLEPDRLKAFAEAARLGFGVVHTSALPESWLTGPERPAYVEAVRASGVTIAAMFIGFDGQSYASLESIAKTVGLSVPKNREHRCGVARLYSDLARDLGVTTLAMHLGFVPNRDEPDYSVFAVAVQHVADYCSTNDQSLLFETGQESAADLLSFIEDIDRRNVGVSFDPANFLLYGTDDPLAALKMLARHVRGVHCKDGFRPSQPGFLGKEVPIGTGEVPFAKLLKHVVKVGYSGPLIIEREHGPEVRADILAGRDYLVRLISQRG